jgi:RNA recognition motif-containing protein
VQLLKIKLQTGRSRGFGFVTYSDARDAEDAIKNLHESEFMGRQIFVQNSNPKAAAGGGGKGGYSAGKGGGGDRGFATGPSDGTGKLFCGGLSWNTTDDSLRECFTRFGSLTDAKVHKKYF